jgi:hypothetical protein
VLEAFWGYYEQFKGDILYLPLVFIHDFATLSLPPSDGRFYNSGLNIWASMQGAHGWE